MNSDLRSGQSKFGLTFLYSQIPVFGSNKSRRNLLKIIIKKSENHYQSNWWLEDGLDLTIHDNSSTDES